jgi:hypothetical protein
MYSTLKNPGTKSGLSGHRALRATSPNCGFLKATASFGGYSVPPVAPPFRKYAWLDFGRYRSQAIYPGPHRATSVTNLSIANGKLVLSLKRPSILLLLRPILSCDHWCQSRLIEIWTVLWILSKNVPMLSRASADDK